MNSMVDIIGRNVAHIEAPCGEENLSVAIVEMWETS